MAAAETAATDPGFEESKGAGRDLAKIIPELESSIE